jgi:hypothetical protein
MQVEEARIHFFYTAPTPQFAEEERKAVEGALLRIGHSKPST